MLVKIKGIDTIKNKVKVTQLDIDDNVDCASAAAAAWHTSDYCSGGRKRLEELSCRNRLSRAGERRGCRH